MLHSELQVQAIRAVNTSLTLRNWFFGFYIVEFEQDGNDRATYGTKLLAEIAKAIAHYNIPNTDERELRRYRQFYLIYPKLAQHLNQVEPIRGILPPDFQKLFSIREMPSPEFKMPNEYILNLTSVRRANVMNDNML
jgi:hypothetical protein